MLPDKLERFVLVTLAAAFIGLAGVAFWQQWSTGQRLRAARAGAITVDSRVDSPPGATTDNAAPGPASSPAAAGIYVHVAGAVAHPGVYNLDAGARVINAIDAAGGPTLDAMLDALNLAVLLRDGDKVYVPTKKEVAWHCGPPAAPAVGGPGDDGSPAAGHVVNINTASAGELDTLPGIGPSLAGRIVAYRNEHGPFADVKDLVKVSGIGEARLQDLLPYITVR